jgi:transposase
MLQIVPQMRIFAACQPVDFRKGIDGLAAECRGLLDADPFSGALFLFRNRARTALKILVYDGTGFWLCHKRLSQGKLKWWPSDGPDRISARELQVLLWHGDPRAAKYDPEWRRIQSYPSEDGADWD